MTPFSITDLGGLFLDTDILRTIFGMKIKALREQSDLSLQELAKRSNMSVSYVNEIEKGKKYPKAEKILQLAQALDRSYDDLVSSKLDQGLQPLSHIIDSPGFRKFPFERFGVSSQELIRLIAKKPKETTALIRMLQDVARDYDMRVEHFFHTALRAYQILHGNTFPHLEAAAENFRTEMSWNRSEKVDWPLLQRTLEEKFGYQLDFETLPEQEKIADLRAVYASDRRILMNPKMIPAQRAFLVAREIGYRVLGLEDRPNSSPALEVGTFDQVYNHFAVSYFAGALLMPRDRVFGELKHFFKNPVWDEKAFREIMDRYEVTPEIFFHRLSEIIPAGFKTKRIHFLKFSKEAGDLTGPVRLTKQLNMSRVHIPNGIGLKEHFCRRWLSVGILHDLERRPDRAVIIQPQRSRFLNYGSEFFCIAAAYRGTMHPNLISSVTIGFQMNSSFKKVVKFWNDNSVPFRELGQTCERCPLEPEACELRVAPPRLQEAERLELERKALVKSLLENKD